MARFLDPNKPLPGCSPNNCNHCPVRDNIHCHFNRGDLFRFLLVMAPSFILGGFSIVITTGWLVLGGWILFILAFFGLIEIRVLCSHCPHYAEPGNHLQCWANYGSPRLWKYRPGPMTKLEKIILLGGFVIIFLFPDALLLLENRWILLVLHLISVICAFAYLQLAMCRRCINLACPLNRTSDVVRFAFRSIHSKK